MSHSGSGALLGLYLVFKYLDKKLINTILSGYFAVMGTGGLTRMLATIAKATLGARSWSKQTKYKFRLTRNASEMLFSLRFTNWHIGFLGLSVVLSLAQWYTKQWVLSNAFALSFAFNAITLLKLDSFKTGSVLLSGLFLWVPCAIFSRLIHNAVFGHIYMRTRMCLCACINFAPS